MTLLKRLNAIVLTTIIIMVFLNLSPSFALETYTIHTMIEKANESNVDMVILQTQLERAEDDYVKSKAISVALDSNRDIDDVLSYEDNVSIKQDPIDKKLAYLNKKYEVMQEENMITYESYELYYTYFNLLEDKKSKKEYYEFMTDKRTAKVKELDLGQITQLQYDIFEKTYHEAFLNYIKANNALDNQEREIKIYLDIDPDTEIVLNKLDMPRKSLDDIDIDYISDEVQSNSYQIKQLSLQKESKEMEAFLKQRFKGFGEKAIEIDLLNDSILELEKKIEDKKRELKKDLYTKYNNALISIQEITIQQLDFDLAKRTYDVDSLKYENGLISVLELAESRKALEDSYYAINNAKVSSFLQIEDFFNFVNQNSVELLAN